MELDKRIKDIGTIQTILRYDVNCIGCKGYFFDEFIRTKDLSKCCYGELIDITTHDDRNDLCFKAEYKEGLVGFYRFFIPEADLKPVEKKYRPFSIEDWKFKHSIGETILYRYKGTYCGDHSEAELAYLGFIKPLDGITDEAGKGQIVLGNNAHGLQNLFDDYEMWVDGGWKPFGVEVEDE